VPRVSVVIPTFNCATCVTQAIDSVAAQTMRDVEVIVVDDGSTDDTRQVLERYIRQPAFRYVFQDNRGVAAAKNTGARLAETEYIAFLDADDALVPEALQQMVAALDASGASWCLTDIWKVYGDRRERQRTHVPAADPLHAILEEDFVRRGIFFRRGEFRDVGMFDEALRTREDWDLGIRMFRMGKPFAYLDRPLCMYVRREGSLTTGSQSQVLRDTERVLHKHHKHLADAGDREAARIYADRMWELARRYLYQARSYQRAAACMRESLAYDLNLGRLLHPLLHHLRRLPRSAGLPV